MTNTINTHSNTTANHGNLNQTDRTSTMSSSLHQTFSPFPILPKEPRWKIWGLYLRERGSIIELYVCYKKDFVLTPNSSILRVNRESRGEAVRNLTCFSFHSTKKVGKWMYFQPGQDLVYLHHGFNIPTPEEIMRGDFDWGDDDDEDPGIPIEDSSTYALSLLAKALPVNDHAKVQHLAVSMNELAHELVEPDLFSRHLRRFLGLKTLVIVFGTWKHKRKRVGDEGLFHMTRCLREMFGHVESDMDEVLENTKRLFPHWKRPKQEVVWWGEEPHTDECMGECNPYEKLII